MFDSISITNTQEGCEKLFSLFSRLNIDKTDVVIGMEAAGHYWLSIREYLTEQSYDVWVINPIQSDAFRKMYIHQTKNDSKNSFIIAQVMRFSEYKAQEVRTAIGAVARKMCNIIFTILRENRPYEAMPPKKSSKTMEGEV